MRKNVIESIISLPWKEVKREENKPKVIEWLFITHLKLNFYILILITCVILTEIAKITYLMVIRKKK